MVNKKPKHVLISGGYRENGCRGVTESVAGIFGFGEAASMAGLEMERKKHHFDQLRDSTGPSRVLSGMGVGDSLALNANRGRFCVENSLQHVKAFVTKLVELVNKLPAIFRQAAG